MNLLKKKLMTKQQFLEIINLHQKQEERIDRLSEIVDYDSPLVEFGWLMFDAVMREAFNEEQCDWINWWLYERISTVSGEELPFMKEVGIKILTNHLHIHGATCIHTPEELWDFIINLK